MRRIEIKYREAEVIKVTVTPERVTIKLSEHTKCDPFWLAGVIDKIIPMQMPSLRGGIFKNSTTLILRNNNNQIQEEFKLNRFWK